LRRLSEQEIEAIRIDLTNLRLQARQVADALGLRYSEALMLLILRELVILQRKLDLVIQSCRERVAEK
jgi:antitoxin component of RelBE/YafQ-DinJ toxin-antitoxin module